MADGDESVLPPPAPPPGTNPGQGPLGMPGGQDRSYQVDIIICAVITAVIGTVFVALRFYTRRVIINVLAWEDWLILAAQVFTVAMCGGFIHGTSHFLPMWFSFLLTTDWCFRGVSWPRSALMACPG